jgi:hypothetical protein
MQALFGCILNLYPSAYRDEFGEEMTTVLMEVQAEVRKKGPLAQAVSYASEAKGLLRGALLEHVRTIFFPRGIPVFSERRLTMRSEFRFPKATVALMTIILAAVMMTIEKAKAISQSVPHANPPVGPIPPAHITIVPTFLIAFVAVCVGGALLWGVLFALHRSGMQRLSDLNPSAGPHSGSGMPG